MTRTGNGLLYKSKDLCVGCRNDYYNGKNDRGISECWLYERAELARRFKIAWWTDPTTEGAFEEVWTLDCHNAPGKYSMEREPAPGALGIVRYGGAGSEAACPARILAMGQDSASRHEPDPRTICISIRSPGSPAPELRPGYVDTLFLEFEDDCWDDWETRDKGMTPAQGDSVADFIRKNEGKFDTVLVHCFVGVSRSVSMAIALSFERVGEYGDTPGRIPNRNVYVITRRAFNRALSEATT